MKRRGKVDDLLGFDEKKLNKLIEKSGDMGRKVSRDVKGTIRKEFGKVGRYKREIIRQKRSVIKHQKKVEYHTELLEKYVNLMIDEETRYLKVMELVNPKVTIKRPTKTLKSYRGKVWWGVSKYIKRRWVEFYIISEKKSKKQNLTEDDVRELGKKKFVEHLIKNDLIFR